MSLIVTDRFPIDARPGDPVYRLGHGGDWLAWDESAVLVEDVHYGKVETISDGVASIRIVGVPYGQSSCASLSSKSGEPVDAPAASIGSAPLEDSGAT